MGGTLWPRRRVPSRSRYTTGTIPAVFSHRGAEHDTRHSLCNIKSGLAFHVADKVSIILDDANSADGTRQARGNTDWATASQHKGE